MANYISSNQNRFYAGVESAFGIAAQISSQNRFPASKLSAHQSLEALKRLDKTGTRTYPGQSSLARRRTAFEVKSYLANWSGTGAPGYGPLFQSALGAAPLLWPGATVASAASGMQIQTSSPHSLTLGGAVSAAGEIRFVTGLPDPSTFVINAPFSSAPQTGELLSPTLTYSLARSLPSVTLYDYWDPISAVSRVIAGAAVDRMDIHITGDYHEFQFSGQAADLLDSQTPMSGAAGLTSFPTEPVIQAFDNTGVPGHLGQAWFGNPAASFLTLTEASIQVRNNLETRNREFGAIYPTAVVPGPREVMSTFAVLAQDDQQTKSLYSAAKLRSPLPFMLQLGIQQGRLMGIYAPSVVPEIPEFDDAQTRLQWRFTNCFAQGGSDDELVIAFA